MTEPDKALEEALRDLRENYINAIMNYLDTGVFNVPQGHSYMKAYT